MLLINPEVIFKHECLKHKPDPGVWKLTVFQAAYRSPRSHIQNWLTKVLYWRRSMIRQIINSFFKNLGTLGKPNGAGDVRSTRQTLVYFQIINQHSFNIQECQRNWLDNSCLVGTGPQDA